MDPNFLFEIPLYQMSGNNWAACPVMAQDDESFYVVGGRGERKYFKDTELTPNQEGKYTFNIEYLDLKFFYPKIDLPNDVEFPAEILERRAHKRKENAIRKDAIFSQDYKEKRLFYYIKGEQLIIKLFGFDESGKMNTEPERETIADKIEIVYGRPAAKATKLKLGHTHLKLPDEVAKRFGDILRAAELRKMALVPAGVSALDGLTYFKFNMNVPAGMFNKVKIYFEDFGDVGQMQGFLTCEPEKVSAILNIPIEGRA